MPKRRHGFEAFLLHEVCQDEALHLSSLAILAVPTAQKVEPKLEPAGMEILIFYVKWASLSPLLAKNNQVLMVCLWYCITLTQGIWDEDLLTKDHRTALTKRTFGTCTVSYVLLWMLRRIFQMAPSSKKTVDQVAPSWIFCFWMLIAWFRRMMLWEKWAWLPQSLESIVLPLLSVNLIISIYCNVFSEQQ